MITLTYFDIPISEVNENIVFLTYNYTFTALFQSVTWLRVVYGKRAEPAYLVLVSLTDIPNPENFSRTVKHLTQSCTSDRVIINK